MMFIPMLIKEPDDDDRMIQVTLLIEWPESKGKYYGINNRNAEGRSLNSTSYHN